MSCWGYDTLRALSHPLLLGMVSFQAWTALIVPLA
jgi:hypothetical protein